jgi:toxin YoeB
LRPPINTLIEGAVRDPFEEIGKSEPLLGNLAGFWSRRIDDTHRLVYAIEDTKIVILACRGHYEQ